MNKKLKIFAIIMALLYVYCIFDNTVLFFPSQSARHWWKKHSDSDKEYIKTLNISLFKNSSEINSIEQVTNKKDGSPVFITSNECEIVVGLDEIPTWYNIYMIFSSIVALFAFVLLIYMPFVFFKILKSLVKDNIFTGINIKRIRKLGYCIIAIGLIATYFHTSDYFVFHQFVELEGYKVSYYDFIDYFSLIFGLALLSVAEALKQALAMKEEQDLTI